MVPTNWWLRWQKSTVSLTFNYEAYLVYYWLNVTAGFLSLESMISDARSQLRRSYSFNDLDQSCDWNEPISESPRSIEVLPKVCLKIHIIFKLPRNHLSVNQWNSAVPLHSHWVLDFLSQSNLWYESTGINISTQHCNFRWVYMF